MGDVDLGGCTDWGRFDLAQLAGFLDEDLSPAWTHVRTWYDTADMASAYRQAVQRIRDDIARIWPPQHSPAAAAYLERLDSMIASLGDVHEASTNNAGALGGVLTTLAGARKQVDGLHEQWQQNEVLYPPNYSTGDEPWRDQLKQQAQQVMVSTDNAVFAYLPRMTAPHPWVAGGSKEPDAVPPDRSGGGSGSGGPGRGPSSSAGSVVRPPAVPPVPPPDTSDARSSSRGGVSPGSAPTLSGGPGPGPGPVSGDGAGSASAPGGSARAALPSPSGSWMVGTPRGRVLRAGGVIGPAAVPWEGAPPRAVGTAPPDVERPSVAPSSGSSGSPRSSGSPTDASEHGAGGLFGGLGGVGGRPGQERRVRGSEAYVEWEVPKGVRPVIEPGPEPTHDPGPGVIGIDR